MVEWKIICIVKKKMFTAAQQVENTLWDAGLYVSLPKNSREDFITITSEDPPQDANPC